LRSSRASKTPGVYLTVNLLAQTANPGASVNRALLIASKSSSGTITPNTQVEEVFGPDDVATLLGAGTFGHLTAKLFYLRNPRGKLDVAARPRAPASQRRPRSPSRARRARRR
jgi:phage tail sheath gpL-like